MRGAGGEFINKGRGQAGHVTAGGRGRGAEGAGSGGCAGSGREHGDEAPRPIGSSLVSLCGGVFFFETRGADEAQGASPGMRSCLQRKWGRARRSAFRLTLCPMVRAERAAVWMRRRRTRRSIGSSSGRTFSFLSRSSCSYLKAEWHCRGSCPRVDPTVCYNKTFFHNRNHVPPDALHQESLEAVLFRR